MSAILLLARSTGAHARRRVSARSASLAFVCVATVAASTLAPIVRVLEAQSYSPERQDQKQQGDRGDHRFRFLLGGAAIGGLLALGYYQLSDGGKQSGRCMPINCALPYLTLSGGISGLFLARELAAQRRAETPRAGEALSFSFTDVKLPSAALDIDVGYSLVVAATDSGAQLLRGGPRPAALRRRGTGLSNLRSVALSASPDNGLVIGTGTALWETPLTTGVLSQVMSGAVDALSVHENTIVAAFGGLVRIRQTANGVSRIDSVLSPASITSIEYDEIANKWWLTGDSLLFDLTIEAGVPVLSQRAQFGGTPRGVAFSRNWIAVALGSDGLAIWPRTGLSGGGGVTSPIVLRGEPRFAFGVALLGDNLYVAGGVDGVTQVSLANGPRIVGSFREAGYATTIVARDGVLWVGDRNKNRVMRIVP